LLLHTNRLPRFVKIFPAQICHMIGQQGRLPFTLR
jgi:hypothetical protein